ncbi:hypothetical protein CR513_59643, partial [Mucuna pruriens]
MSKIRRYMIIKWVWEDYYLYPSHLVAILSCCSLFWVDPSPPKADLPILTNYVPAPLSIYKLDGTNYDTWAPTSSFGLRVDSILKTNRSHWNKIDAQLSSKFGNRHEFFTPMIVRAFIIIAPCYLDGPMDEYLGKLSRFVLEDALTSYLSPLLD